MMSLRQYNFIVSCLVVVFVTTSTAHALRTSTAGKSQPPLIDLYVAPTDDEAAMKKKFYPDSSSSTILQQRMVGSSPQTPFNSVEEALDYISDLRREPSTAPAAPLDIVLHLLPGRHQISSVLNLGGSSPGGAKTKKNDICSGDQRMGSLTIQKYIGSDGEGTVLDDEPAVLSSGVEVEFTLLPPKQPNSSFPAAVAEYEAYLTNSSMFSHRYIWQAFTAKDENGNTARVHQSHTGMLRYASRNTSSAGKGLALRLDSSTAGGPLHRGEIFDHSFVWVYHSWTASISQIESFNLKSNDNNNLDVAAAHQETRKSRTASSKIASANNDDELILNGSMSGFYAGSGNRFWVKNVNWENVPEVPSRLLTDNTFHFNPDTRRMIFRPVQQQNNNSSSPPQPPKTVKLLVPTLVTLLNLQNCTGLTIRDVSFEHTDSGLDWCLPHSCDGTQASGALPFGVINADVTTTIMGGSSSSTSDKRVPLATSTRFPSNLEAAEYEELRRRETEQENDEAGHGIDGDGSIISNVQILNCTFAHIGSFAMRFKRGVKNVLVDSTRMYDLAAGGIRIGQAVTGQQNPELYPYVPHNIQINNSIITDGGHVVDEGEGVFIQQAYNITISHNSIFDMYYSGVGMGWSWNYVPTWNKNIIVHKNHFHNLGRGRLSDFGCVHSLGVTTGSVTSNNLCHDIQSYGYGGHGLYADQATMGMTYENNIVYRTKAAAYQHHYGLDITLRNNVLAYPQRIYTGLDTNNDEISIFLVDGGVSRGTPPKVDPSGAYQSSFLAENNIFLLRNASGSLFRVTYVNAVHNMTLRNNCYWNEALTTAPGGNLENLEFPTYENVFPWNNRDAPSNKTFAFWTQTDKQDQGSIVVDPQFPDSDSSYNFFNINMSSRCVTSSVGFKPIDPVGVGSDLSMP